MASVLMLAEIPGTALRRLGQHQLHLHPDGQPAIRTDANGTTTYGYDDLGRLVSRVNTAGGGTIAYGYDLASTLVSTTDSRGTTGYAFDDAGP